VTPSDDPRADPLKSPADPRHIVATGYDRIAQRYLER